MRDIPPCLPRWALCLEAVPKNLKGIFLLPSLGDKTLASPSICPSLSSVPGQQAPNHRTAYLLRPVMREYKRKHVGIATHCPPGQGLTL